MMCNPKKPLIILIKNFSVLPASLCEKGKNGFLKLF